MGSLRIYFEVALSKQSFICKQHVLYLFLFYRILQKNKRDMSNQVIMHVATYILRLLFVIDRTTDTEKNDKLQTSTGTIPSKCISQSIPGHWPNLARPWTLELVQWPLLKKTMYPTVYRETFCPAQTNKKKRTFTKLLKKGIQSTVEKTSDHYPSDARDTRVSKLTKFYGRQLF